MIFTAIASAATAIGGLLSSTFLAGGVGSFLLKAAVGIGINFLSAALQAQPEKPQFSITGKLQSGDDQPRSFPVGKTATAGSLAYANTWGNAGDTPNAYLTQVIVLSDLPGPTLRNLYVNGVKVTIDYSDTSYEMGYPIVEYDDGGGDGNTDNHLWIKFYDGTQTAADSFLVNRVGSQFRPYENTRVGHGLAYAIVTSQVDEELFTGFPTFKFEISGIPLYDASKDSSVGGNGTQRLNDWATWEVSENPTVQIQNLLLGIKYNDQWFYGVQNLPFARTPAPHWIEQINKCNIQVQGPDGLEPIYRSSGFIAVDAPVIDAVSAIQTACSGKLTEIGGTYKFPLGEPSSIAQWSISDDVILSTEEQSFTPFFGLADTVNGVTARYPSPDDNWNTKSAPPLYNAEYEAEDGNRRLLADVELNFVPYKGQVQRLMKSALNEARRARRLTLTLPPEYFGIEPGDVVAVTMARNGYESKLHRVDGAADKANSDIVVDLTEVDPSDYDWNQGADYRPPVVGPINQHRPPAQLLAGWQVAPAIYYDADGDARRPSIQVSYAGGQLDVDGLRIQVREAWGAKRLIYDAPMPYDAPESQQYSVILDGTFLPNSNYEARGIYTSVSARPFEWSAWLPVTTPNVLLTEKDIYLPGIVDEINEATAELVKWASHGTREELEEAWDNVNLTVDQDSNNFSDKQVLRRELSSNYEDITANYTEAILVATGPNSALAQRIESLEVYVDDTVATAIDLLSTEITEVDGRVTANANAITQLDATVGDVSASGLFRVYAQATPAGADARIALSVSATDGGDPATAALFLDAMSDGTSRIVAMAEQFIVTDGANDVNPFVFQGGIAYMENARIGTVIFNQLSSANGKLILKGSGANASIEVFT